MSKSSQKKGAQDAGREPGRGCAWDLQILKTFQGESAGLRPCAPRQGGARPQAPYIKFRRFPQFRACAHLCTLLLGRFGLLCPHPCAPARMHVLRL